MGNRRFRQTNSQPSAKILHFSGLQTYHQFHFYCTHSEFEIAHGTHMLAKADEIEVTVLQSDILLKPNRNYN